MFTNLANKQGHHIVGTEKFRTQNWLCQESGHVWTCLDILEPWKLLLGCWLLVAMENPPMFNR